MTENIPPVPKAPQYPAQPPAGYDQPPQQYAPPASYQQPYPQQQQYAPFPPQQYAPYPPQQYVPQWAPAGPRLPKSSGFRVASGIVGIVLGAWLFIPSIAGFGHGLAFLAFMVLIAALGNLVAGIVLLANQRGRLRGAPVTALSFAGFTLFLGLIALAVEYFGPALLVTTLPLATAVLVVMGIGLSREKRGA
ncbi:hypothetical protein [Pseudarthrobacter sp. H2]|uniref:hypothetical protein n=1 Tax=Pseudarthrobacter sp. H2 TaxID=3418415 RepID=UPI003CEA4F4D